MKEKKKIKSVKAIVNTILWFIFLLIILFPFKTNIPKYLVSACTYWFIGMLISCCFVISKQKITQNYIWNPQNLIRSLYLYGSGSIIGAIILYFL